MDDRALTRSTGWTRTSGNAYYGGTLTSSSTQGAKLTLSGVRAARIALIATTCPGCGKVEIRHAGIVVGTINLDRATTTRQKILELPSGPLRTGTVSIRIVSSGKPVQIDGLAVAPF